MVATTVWRSRVIWRDTGGFRDAAFQRTPHPVTASPIDAVDGISTAISVQKASHRVDVGQIDSKTTVVPHAAHEGKVGRCV